MDNVLDKISEWIKLILIGSIEHSLSGMFGDVNEKVGIIAAEVGRTPEAWNSHIFSLVRSLSETVIMPVAAIIITYVLCAELIGMVLDRNSMHDTDTFMLFRYLFKAGVAVLLVSHTFDITIAVFDVGQHIVTGAAGVIHGDTAIDIDTAIAALRDSIAAMEVPELLLLTLETFIVSFCLKIMSVLITVILYGRMIEIYCTCSIAPVPFATLMNKDWNQTGTNYLRGLFALAIQGFFLMLCVGIYAVLVNEMIISTNIHSAIFSLASYTILLCFTMMKTGNFAKSILNAH